MKLRVMTVFGTRPEGIKMMPVVREIRNRPHLEQIVCITGQHRHMLDQVFAAFGERPNIDLNIMAPNQSLGDITAKVILRMSEVLAREKPQVVLVHGDTTTAMAAAIAAFYARVRIGHVEAGLRSFDLHRPWPEEFNRVAIDFRGGPDVRTDRGSSRESSTGIQPSRQKHRHVVTPGSMPFFMSLAV